MSRSPGCKNLVVISIRKVDSSKAHYSQTHGKSRDKEDASAAEQEVDKM